MATSRTAEMKAHALAHRVEAVKLLNQALSKPAQTKEEDDARFAAFLILAGQSCCMADGLFDFLTMLRGCIFQGTYLGILGRDTHFCSFAEHNHLKEINEMDLEVIEPSALDAAMRSLTQLQPYCEGGVEKIYLDLLTNLVQDLYTSLKAGTRKHLYENRIQLRLSIVESLTPLL